MGVSLRTPTGSNRTSWEAGSWSVPLRAQRTPSLLRRHALQARLASYDQSGQPDREVKLTSGCKLCGGAIIFASARRLPAPRGPHRSWSASSTCWLRQRRPDQDVGFLHDFRPAQAREGPAYGRIGRGSASGEAKNVYGVAAGPPVPRTSHSLAERTVVFLGPKDVPPQKRDVSAAARELHPVEFAWRLG